MKQLNTGQLEFNSFDEASYYFADLLKKETPVHSENEKNQDSYKKEIVELRNVNYSIPIGKIFSFNSEHAPTPFWAISETLSEILNLPRPIMERYKPELMDWSYSMTPDRMPCYTYGERLHNYNQLMNIFNKLDSNITSKRAILSIYQGYDCEPSRTDVPCTIYWNIGVRDNVLDLTTHMRSWDFFAGQIYDTFLANFVAQSFISWLKNSKQKELIPGKLNFFSNSLHYYPSKSKDKLDKMLTNKTEDFYNNGSTPFKLNLDMKNYFQELYRLSDGEQSSYNGNFSYAEDKLNKISEPIFRDFLRIFLIRNAKTYKNAYLQEKYSASIETEEMQRWLKIRNI